MSDSLTLSRQDLYELAWSKPMVELAQDFGISDVALAKRLRKLGIPVPGRGYWARVPAARRRGALPCPIATMNPTRRNPPLKFRRQRTRDRTTIRGLTPHLHRFVNALRALKLSPQPTSALRSRP
jgi:hypothetical protein